MDSRDVSRLMVREIQKIKNGWMGLTRLLDHMFDIICTYFTPFPSVHVPHILRFFFSVLGFTSSFESHSPRIRNLELYD